MNESYRPYVVRDSGRSVDEIVAQVNEAQWYGYGPDYRAGGIDKVIAGPLIDFDTFLSELVATDHLRFVTHRHLVEYPEPEPGMVRVAIRHDIDSDIVSALAQAEIEQRLGIAATWLVLHTAPYYGSFDEDGIFRRHDAMAAHYRRLQELGHEVSLHTDPLGLYQLHGVDGAAAVSAELEWLRSQGIDIVGTTAHNHRSTYGAENYEVFREYVVPDGGGHDLEATHVEHNGARAPLRVLDATKLGLSYEGNQILWRQPELDYCSARFVNEWASPWFRRQQRSSDKAELQFVDQDRVIEHLQGLSGGQDAVVVIHPEYFGARTAIDQPPMIDPEPVGTKAPWSAAGWLHFQPWSVIVDKVADPPRPTVGIAVANEWGRPGLPVAERLDDTDVSRRVVVVGSDRTLAPALAVPAAWPERTARLLSRTTGHRWASFVMADRSMGIDRLWSWLEFARTQTGAKIVVAEVPADVDADVGVHRWGPEAAASGASGTYLVTTPGGIAKRHFSPDHVSRPSGSPHHVSGDDGSAGVAMYRWCVQTLTAQGCAVVLALTDPTAAAPSWVTELAATNDRVRVAGPVSMAPNASSLTYHRQLSEQVSAQVIACSEEFSMSDESVSNDGHPDALAEVDDSSLVDLDDRGDPTDAAPEAEVLAQHTQARSAIGLRTYPPPFDAVVAIVSDIDGSATPFFLRYIEELVHDWGLDFGDSIHYAGYHQRYALDRRRIRSRHRSILNYQLRLDNTPIGLTGSWLAHVLRSYHRGDIDHLHGLYAWGARALSLQVLARPGEPSSARAVTGYADMTGVERFRSLWLRRKLPYSINAEYFPVVSCAVTTRHEVLMPDRVTARWPSSSIEMYLSDARPGPDGTRTSIYTTPVEHLEVMDLNDQPVLHPQRALIGIDIDLDPDDIVGAALHNTDRSGIAATVAALQQRYRLGFDLLTTHGQYHFYAQGQLDFMSKRALRTQEKYRPDPIALYGAPRGTDVALAAIADIDWSPAAVQTDLLERGLRFLTPIGYIARGQEPFDAAEATFPVVDRSGNRLWYLQRCLPRLPPGAPNPNTSRLSSFEARLEALLSDVDQRVRDGKEGGFWPFYTHVGQTADLDEPPDPWFGGQGLAALAHRFWGSTSGPRPWVTRASVFANYSQVLQRLPALTRRDADRIEINNASADQPGDRPLRCADLFGVSFDVADPAAAAVYLDSEPIDELWRCADTNTVTVVGCAIRWPIIDAVDPRELAAIGGDVGSVDVDSGDWTWHSADRRSQRYGSLHVGPDGVASVRLELAELDVSGAQVVTAEVRASDGVSRVEVGLVGGTGHRMVVSDQPAGEGRDHPLGFLRVDLARGRWERRHLPLWAATGAEPLPRSVPRSIRVVEVRIEGQPGATLDVAELSLGRPKTNAVVSEPGALVGGEAGALEWVEVISMDGTERHRCAVEPSGIFVTPKLEPGGWIIEAPQVAPRAIQVDTDRFDIMLRPSELANPSRRSGTRRRLRRIRRMWRRRSRLGQRVRLTARIR